VEVVSVAARNDDGRIVGCRTALTDISALKRDEERLALLAAASQALGGSIEDRTALGTALSEVLQSLVPSQADLAFIDLVDGKWFRRFESGPRPGSPAVGRPDRGFLAPALGPDAPQRRVVESGKPILIPIFTPGSLSRTDWLDHEQAIRAVGARSLLYLPLVSREERLGVLTLVSTDEQRRYGGADLSFATDLASRIAAAVDNEALYRNAAIAIRAREDVLSFVAHDLRGLVNGIQLTVELLLGRGHRPERRRGWKQLERVQRVTEQMSHMIDDIQDVAAVEAGKLVFDLADLIADDLVIQTREQFASVATTKGVVLETRLANEAMQVRADLTRVMRVLGNLVGNAIKFTPTGGSVTISSSIARGHVLFAVRDTGIGVAVDQVPRLFDRYWQANEAGHKGRGLGLFIAKRLIEGQGGSIWVESEVGSGTTMFFTLPRSSPVEANEHAAGAAAPAAEAEPAALERR